MKIITTVAAVSLSVFLSACHNPSAVEGGPVPDNILPEGLKDCTFYTLRDENYNRYTIVRCPLSSTSVTNRSGKVSVNTTTIDEVGDRQKKLDEISAAISRAEAEIAALKAKQESLR